MGRKRERPPPTPEEALLDALLDRAHALHDLFEDLQTELLEVLLDLSSVEDSHDAGGELRLEELKTIEEKVGALEARLGRA